MKTSFAVVRRRRVDALIVLCSLVEWVVGKAHTKSRRVPLTMDRFLFHAEIKVSVNTTEVTWSSFAIVRCWSDYAFTVGRVTEHADKYGCNVNR